MRRDPFGGDQEADQPRSVVPTPVSDALAGLARDRGWRERLEGARVHEVWREAAGPDVARNVRPVRLHGGVLVVEACSSAWATQVRYLAGDLARRVNEEMGGTWVRQVRVTTARGGQRGS